MTNPFVCASGQVSESSGSASLTVSNATAVGDAIVVWIGYFRGSVVPSVSNVTDSAGNSYTQIVNGASGDYKLYGYVANAAGNAGGPAALSTSSTITVTLSSTASLTPDIIAVACPGYNTVDVSNYAENTGASSSVSATPNYSSELAVAGVWWNGNLSISWSSPFTGLSPQVSNTMAAAYDVGPTAGSSLTATSTQENTISQIAFITLEVASSSVSVTGALGTISVSALAGTVGVATTGVLGNITVSAPAGVVSLSGNWTIFGPVGTIAAAAPPGAPGIGPAGTTGLITVAAPAGTFTGQIHAPASVVPAYRYGIKRRRPAAGLGTARHRNRRNLPLLAAIEQRSSVAMVQAPPMMTWNIRATISASAVMTWNVRELLAVPPSTAGEIEVLPIWGLPAPGTRPQIAWNIRSGITAQTQLAVHFAIRFRRKALRTPLARRRGIPAAPALSRQSAAIQAAGPPIAWNLHNNVSVTARAAWNLHRAVTVTAYAAWNTGPGTHGILAVTAVMTWNTEDQVVQATALMTWETRDLIAATAIAGWETVQHLAVTRTISWDTLTAAASTRYSAARRPRPARRTASIKRMLRGIPAGGWTMRSAAAAVPGASAQIRWDVRAQVTQTAAMTWETRATIAATAQATWETRHIEAATTALIAWDLKQTRDAAQLATWNVHNGVTATALITWDTRIQVTQLRTYLLQRRLPGSGTRPRRRGIPARAQASWTAVRPVGPSCLAIASWDVYHQVTARATITWDTYQTRATATAIIKWDINPTIHATATMNWRMLQQVQAVTTGTERLRFDIQRHRNPAFPQRPRKRGTPLGASSAGSSFLPAGIATPGIGWNIRQTRGSTPAQATWDVIATIDPGIGVNWNTFGKVTVSTPPIQWNVGQPVQGGMRLAAMDEWFIAE